MSREHDKEIIAYSLESVVEDLDTIIKVATKDAVDVNQLIDRLDTYRNSLSRVAKLVKGN